MFNLKIFILFSFFVFFSKNIKSQELYNPTLVYDAPGGMFDINQIYDLHLTFYDTAYFDTLVSWWYNNNESRLPAKIDFNTIHYDSVGIKFKGNSTFYIANTFNNIKVPYNIDVNYYVGGQNLLGYKKLKLGNALFDPSFCKEALSSYIYNQYLPSHQTSLIRLHVNGDYIGVYTNTESISKQFLNKHFNEKNGVFFKCESFEQFGSGQNSLPPDLLYRGADSLLYLESYERKSDSGWTDFIHLIDVLNNNPSQIESVLNVDRVLWFFAVNMVVSNEDAYNTLFAHNYYVYQTDDSLFQIIPWDLSESFCGILLDDSASFDIHYLRDVHHGLMPFVANRPLVYKILSNPEYLKTYYAHINTIIEENTDTTFIRGWINSLQSIAAQSVLTDVNKFFSFNEFISNVDSVLQLSATQNIAAIMETLRHRLPYLNSLSYLQAQQPSVTNVIQNIALPLSGDNVIISAYVTNATSVHLMTTISPFASKFAPTPMFDDGTNGDLIAGDGIYSAIVPHQNSLDHVKYYIKADNGNTVKLNPQRAEYFYYHYIVDKYLTANLTATTPNFDVKVYPNPADQSLNVYSNDFIGQVDLNIYNTNGQLVLNQKVNSFNNQIDVVNLNSGVYILEIINNQQKLTEKIIIQH